MLKKHVGKGRRKAMVLFFRSIIVSFFLFMANVEGVNAYVINDEPSGALPIPTIGIIYGNNSSASTYEGEPGFGDFDSEQTLWYKFVATKNGIAVLWMDESFYYVSLSLAVDVFSSSEPNISNRIALAITENNYYIGPQNFLRLQFPTVAGKEYYIRVGTVPGFGGYGREFILNLRQHGPQGGVDIARVMEPVGGKIASIVSTKGSMFVFSGYYDVYDQNLISANHRNLYIVVNSTSKEAKLSFSSTIRDIRLSSYDYSNAVKARSFRYSGGVRTQIPGVIFLKEALNLQPSYGRVGYWTGRLGVVARTGRFVMASRSFSTSIHRVKNQSKLNFSADIAPRPLVAKIGSAISTTLTIKNNGLTDAKNCRLDNMNNMGSAMPGSFLYYWRPPSGTIGQYFTIKSRSELKIDLKIVPIMHYRSWLLKLDLACDKGYAELPLNVELWGTE